MEGFRGERKGEGRRKSERLYAADSILLLFLFPFLFLLPGLAR